MAFKKITLSKWTAAMETSPNSALYNGMSPGGVANQLGISRQAVHRAIHRGELDAWRVLNDRDGTLIAICILDDSLAKYKAARTLRNAG